MKLKMPYRKVIMKKMLNLSNMMPYYGIINIDNIRSSYPIASNS